MLQIAIQPVPSQQLAVVLDSQNCQIALYQKSTGMFFDLNADGVEVCVGVLARDTVPLNPCASYTAFTGNLLLSDLQGSDDPQYAGLGTRWCLFYLTAEEMADYQFA